MIPELLAPLDVAGMVLTLDALHTTKKTARLITETLHAHYLLILKGNQPLARAAARLLLQGPDSEFTQTTAIEDDRGHARIERRTIRTALPTRPCSPALTRSSGSAGTPEDSTVTGRPRKSSSASPACPPPSPAPRTSTTTRGSTGQWKTGSTGSAM